MKHFFAFAALLLTLSAAGQRSFEATVKQYFRVNPFEGNFSGFVETLSTDSALLSRKMYKQTDSTGYYLRGTYEVFNPFRINANKVDMIFYEGGALQTYSPYPPKYYVYQLTAYFDDTELNRRMVKKDYRKIINQFKKMLFFVDVNSLKGYRNIEDGGITSMNSQDAFRQPPLTISWQTLSQTRQLGLTIIIRFLQANNEAVPLNLIHF